MCEGEKLTKNLYVLPCYFRFAVFFQKKSLLNIASKLYNVQCIDLNKNSSYFYFRPSRSFIGLFTLGYIVYIHRYVLVPYKATITNSRAKNVAHCSLQDVCVMKETQTKHTVNLQIYNKVYMCDWQLILITIHNGRNTEAS